MLNFYTYNDFKGKINLDLGDPNVQAQFDAFAVDEGEEILRDLLDDDLYQQLIDDLDSDNNPQTQIFIDLVNGKDYERPSGKTVNYDGLKKMLRYFVYASWVEDNWSSNVSTGQVINVNENSEKVDRSELRKVWSKRYNEAVRLYNEAFRYINDEYETYFDTSTNDYSFWQIKNKRYKGRITMGTPKNNYFYNRSSDGN